MAKFKHHSHFPKADTGQTYRFPFVCFHCRKSFKYPALPERRVCPQCGGAMERLGRKFSAPKATDAPQWRKVQYLVEHGFRFQTVYLPVAPGVSRSVAYPRTLKEAEAFVKLVAAARQADGPLER